ncbi:MAG: FAD:protein FMN transferase [Granulosicoccus sp.]|nr:FAD:protein FMN transferase [Granulosicoccus sp.]
MNRRSYLKSSLMVGGSLLLPPGVLSLAGCSGTARPPELGAFDGLVMGTGYSVRYGHAPVKGLEQAVLAALQDVDTHMSTWKENSELSLLNRSTDSDWQPMSTATTAVIAHAMQTSANTDGAFDATVGPLVDLWGFGAGSAVPAGGTGQRPAVQSIRQTMSRIGHEFIEVDVQTSSVRKRKPGIQIDLSGIAKGHAVDRVAAVLDERGVDSYLVEVGGELAARGRKPDGSAWKVAIEKPAVARRDVFRVLDLENRAIATSGDYRNFFHEGGKRYSHAIDPRTGQPVTHDLASVSVVAQSAMAADALSTALMIMGADGAMAFAEQHDVAAQLILKSGDALAERHSAAFSALLG